jgi:multisubunit Na+/H+ antiporter MnhG subunit
MENKSTTKSTKTGIIILVLGIALVLIAQTIPAEVEGRDGEAVETNTKSIVQYIGIGLLVIGGLIFASSTTKKNSSDNKER